MRTGDRGRSRRELLSDGDWDNPASGDDQGGEQRRLTERLGPILRGVGERPLKRPKERRGALVIGGAVVELDGEGRAFAKAATVRYLEGLAETFGKVHFFAPAVHKELCEYGNELGGNVVFHPLLHVDRSGLRRVTALFHDLRGICGTGRRVEAALEFFPFAGGVLGTTLLRAVAARYGVYFGTDPFQALRSLRTLSDRRRQLLKRLASRVAPALADFVLVRDPRQFRALGLRNPQTTFLSAPISAVRHPPTVRADRCTGGEITLLYVGMFSRRKGLADLLALVRRLGASPEHRYRLLLVGAPEMLGPDRYTLAELREICRELEVEHLVEFRGYVDDMTVLGQVYESADIFVFASRREGFPRVVEEALLYGLPVVAYELASLAEVLRDRVHALLVAPGDIDGLAKAVRRIVDDAPLRRMLAADGRDLMKSRYPVPAARQHAQLMRSPLGEAAARRDPASSKTNADAFRGPMPRA